METMVVCGLGIYAQWSEDWPRERVRPGKGERIAWHFAQNRDKMKKTKVF
ncbi:MAG: hypothetical protein LBD02_10815 [Christensenellaceae bacterium]|jgi:hypothetical protein|nr:hypothetical protein [Christensenellaceae bacterium]